MGIPYCFVKCKARLGKLVHQKNATCVALTEVRKEDHQDLENLAKNFRASYNDVVAHQRTWGGGVMGIKHDHKMERRNKAIQEEIKKKAGL
jgi:large subunit ribosomal protein L7Ae